MLLYRNAPEVESIAEVMIAEIDDHFSLADADIRYVWRPEAPLKNGKLVLATASKVTGRNAFLATGENCQFFVLEVAEDTWARLDAKQRAALVDHELMHMTYEETDEGEPLYGLRGHDLEEFAAIVRRHGFWKSDVGRFSEAVAEQLTFAMDDAASFVEPKPKDEDGPDQDERSSGDNPP